MNSWLSQWSLALMTFLPLVGAAIMMAVPKEEEEAHKAIAVATSLGTLLVGIWVMFKFDWGSSVSTSSTGP